MSQSGIDDLIETMQRLRDPQKGCPWDKEQTHQSLVPYLLEESYEFIEALECHGADAPESIEELGDVLFQVAFHCQLYSEKSLGDLQSLARQTAEKYRARHPHVFNDHHPKYSDAKHVRDNWEQLKAQQKKQNAGQVLPRTQSLKSVPRHLPALQRSHRLGEKAGGFGFDWPDALSVRDKVIEEFQEWQKALSDKDIDSEKEELGDLFFALSQYCRKKGWDAEELTRKANHKFLNRFEALEKYLQEKGYDWKTLDIGTLEAAWKHIKSNT